MPTPLDLSPARVRAFERIAADFSRVVGPRFLALVAYGDAASLVLVTAIAPADLDALSALAPTWTHDGVTTPLVLTPDEFRRSLDAFPFEYQTILDRHVLIAGHDPFGDVRVHPADLRRACEVEAKGHLIHLRQGWLDAGGDTAALADLLVRSATPWRLLAIRLAGLDAEVLADDAAVAAWTTTRTGLAADLSQALLALDDTPEGAAALVPRLPEYLAAAERLWHATDLWPRR